MDKDGNYRNYNMWSFRTKPAPSKQLDRIMRIYYRRNFGHLLPKEKDAVIIELGCGRGQFLGFLRDEKYTKVKGVDQDSKNIEICRKNRHDATRDDMFAYVRNLPDRSISLFIMEDVIEHISKEDIVSFLQDIRVKLAENGRLIIKTCNCNNIYGLSTFFGDFTHMEGYTENKIHHLSIICGFSSCRSFNVYYYFGIPVLDELFKLWNYSIYKKKKILFLLNGKVGDAVFSKNILAVLYF